MELTNTCNNNSLNPTQKLKSSPVPIQFISFNRHDEKCNYCENKYSKTLLFSQKYCKDCLLKYCKDNNTVEYLDVHILQLKESNVVILHFKQIISYMFDEHGSIKKREKDCKLCGKLIYQKCFRKNIDFRLCSDCYKISSGWIELTLTKKTIPILYLPWWDAHDQCTVCNQILKFSSDHQKWCSNCIIIYIGCRYCLTTNIIFGIMDRSQCKKCERISLITIDIKVIERKKLIFFTKFNDNNYHQIANYMDNSTPLGVYSFIRNLNYISLNSLKPLMDWMPYLQITNLENNGNIIVPIMFIPININEDQCHYCNEPYSETLLFQQKYCKHCLFLYIKYTANNNLDVCISTKQQKNSTWCDRHKLRNLDFYTKNIQEWCNSCSEVSCFKQIVTNYRFDYRRQEFNESMKYCKFCGKLINDQISNNHIEFRLCPNCYQISSGWIESSLTEKDIPILYLSWWDANNQCVSCGQILKFNSNLQKWCPNCIIIYIGCRYCLTTSIIFGITNLSRCKRCERLSLITIEIKTIEREIIFSTKINSDNHYQIVNYMDNRVETSAPLEVYSFISNLNYLTLRPLMDWCSYSQITDLENPIVPIMFIPFNNNENECYYCKESYFVTPLFQQKYCRYCLNLYIKYTANNNLDICINMKDTQCNRHKPRSLDFCTQNIQEWCNDCSEVSYFNQVVTNCRFDVFNKMYFHRKEKVIESGKHCKLCGKLIYDQISSSDNIEFRLCPNCYQISFGWIKSTLTERINPILNLPWWDANNQCISCDQILEFDSSGCQKWCSNCIIIYIGCRYCLTTNIIFGIINQSKCKKCNRIFYIDDKVIGVVPDNKQVAIFNDNAYKQIAHLMNNISKNSNQLEKYKFIIRLCLSSKSLMDRISYSQITNLENNENLIVPIIFIPFNNNEDECYYCKEPYSVTPLFQQRYCRYCLFLYFKYTANNNLDVGIISIENTQCNRHKPRSLDFCTQNIQEWCNDCSEVSYFKQIVTNCRIGRFYDDIHRRQKFIENEKYCKLCRKLIYDQISSDNIEFRLCLNCYQINFGRVESTLTEQVTPILYLPWWDANEQCVSCDQILKFNSSDCQKWCPNCIIIYIGCRYCLTTNIIFGIINQSQCKACKRILSISDNIKNIDIYSGISHIMKYITIFNEFTNFIENILNENTNPLIIYDFIKRMFLIFRANQAVIKEIPYSQISNLEKIAEGGFGIIYKATWMSNNVAVKRFLNSQNISKSFLNEVISFIQCYNRAYIIKVHGITQDLKSKDYMLVMEYAIGGNLHDYLQRNFVGITWNKKLRILWRISEGLNIIHGRNIMHRDFHSGNILLSTYETWLICDLGLSQPANNTSSNNEIYGVIPYIAPELFRGSSFSKESDIYSLGMIMWELITGCKPFADVDHDINLIYNIIDGKRPEITSDTPECYANLMKKCWNSDPSKRPSIIEIARIFGDWYHKNEYVEQFEQAEIKRLELIQLKQLGPIFNKKSHHNAIYTSRPLSFMISNQSSIVSFNLRRDSNKLIENNEEYISEELNLDIEIRSSKRNISKVLHNDTQSHRKNFKAESSLSSKFQVIN